MEEDDVDGDDVDDDEDGDNVDGGDLLRPLLPVLDTWPPLLPPRPDILEPDQDYHQLHPSESYSTSNNRIWPQVNIVSKGELSQGSTQKKIILIYSLPG